VVADEVSIPKVVDGDGREYDPLLHLTAAELRAVGVPIPEQIPDCAWLPRRALTVVPHSAKAESFGDPDHREFRVTWTMQSSEPFRWLEIKGTLEP